MRYRRISNTCQNGYALIDRRTGNTSKSLQLQTQSENTFPVIKIDRKGNLLYSNLASIPLLSYWGARDLKVIPVAFLNKYPQIFSNEDYCIQLPYKDETYSFHRELSADETYVTLVMQEKSADDLTAENAIKDAPGKLSIEIDPAGQIVAAFCDETSFLGLPVTSFTGSSFFKICEAAHIEKLISKRSYQMMEHAGSDLTMTNAKGQNRKLNAEIFIVRDPGLGLVQKVYINLRSFEFNYSEKFAKAYQTGSFARFRSVFNDLSSITSMESAFDHVADFIHSTIAVSEIGIFNFKNNRWIYPGDKKEIFSGLDSFIFPKDNLKNLEPLMINTGQGELYMVLPAETNYRLSHCLCFRLDENFNTDDVVMDLIHLLFSQAVAISSKNILGLDKIIEKDDLLEILNNLQDVFYRTDADGLLVMINNSIADLLGYLPEEVRGMPVRNFYCREEEHTAIRSHLKSQGQLKNKRISMRHKEGHEVQIILNARALFDTNKNYLGSEGIMHDATELISKEASLRALFESSFRSIISLDKSFHIKALNDRARSDIKHNLDFDIEVGSSVKNLFRSQEFYNLNTSIVKAFKGEQSKTQQVFTSSSKGSVWYNIDLIPIINLNNSIDEILFIAENVTQLKKKETEISRLYKALDENPNEVYIFDANNFNVLYNNEGALLNLGYTRDELKKLVAWDFMIRYNEVSFEQLIYKLKTAEVSELTFETRHQRKSGKHYPVEVHLTLNDTGGSTFLVCIAIDITARKRQEIILRKKNKELEKVNFELDRFVYSASHDLKAPLRSVLGLISIARKEIKDDNNQIYFDMMNKSIHKLDGFISDMIDYSRNTRLEMDNTRVDLKTLLDETLDNLRYHEGTGMVDVSIDLNMKCDFVSDPKRLGIILNNLCSNSVKYRDEQKEKPYMHIKIDCDTSRALIIVQDNGIGIPKEDHKKIFGMFFRSSAKSYGSGLGLYIVNEIVAKLGGTIQVVSEPDKGTEFFIQIPNKLKNNTFVDEFGMSH